MEKTRIRIAEGDLTGRPEQERPGQETLETCGGQAHRGRLRERQAIVQSPGISNNWYTFK